MFTFLFGFAAAVGLSIVAPDKFAAVSKFIRSIPGKFLGLFKV